MDTVRIHEKIYEVIEIFEFHLLVQEIGGGNIFLIEYQHINAPKVERKLEESNVINLRGYARWPRTKTKAKKYKVI